MCLSFQQIFTKLTDVDIVTIYSFTQHSRKLSAQMANYGIRASASIHHRRGVGSEQPRLFVTALNCDLFSLSAVSNEQTFSFVESVCLSETQINLYHITWRCFLEDSSFYFCILIVLSTCLRFGIHDAFQVSQGIKKCSYVGYIFYLGRGKILRINYEFQSP
jgi:hypothetical protein